MTDPISIIITVIVTILVILLVIIGIEIFKTLRQCQKVLVRLDDVLKDLGLATNAVATPISKISTLIQGLQQGSNVIGLLSKIVERVLEPNKKNAKS